jgi:hypothetical protein
VHLDVIEFVVPYLTQLREIQYSHPSHDPEYIPTLRPHIVEDTLPLIRQVLRLSVNDVHREAWHTLIHCLGEQGSRIKVLNLECSTEKEPFLSHFGLSDMFSRLEGLECLRLDAAAIGKGELGGDADVLHLATSCQHLRAISIDYCDVTLESFYTLWNHCENLDFLAVAGLSETRDMVRLRPKPKLRTLRFVDVQLNDRIVLEIDVDESCATKCSEFGDVASGFRTPTCVPQLFTPFGFNGYHVRPSC